MSSRQDTSERSASAEGWSLGASSTGIAGALSNLPRGNAVVAQWDALHRGEGGCIDGAEDKCVRTRHRAWRALAVEEEPLSCRSSMQWQRRLLQGIHSRVQLLFQWRHSHTSLTNLQWHVRQSCMQNTFVIGHAGGEYRSLLRSGSAAILHPDRLNLRFGSMPQNLGWSCMIESLYGCNVQRQVDINQSKHVLCHVRVWLSAVEPPTIGTALRRVQGEFPVVWRLEYTV